MAKYTDMPAEMLLLVASFLRPPPPAYAKHFTAAVVGGNGEEAVEVALQKERADVINLSSVNKTSREVLIYDAFRCVSIVPGDANKKIMALLRLVTANPAIRHAVKHLYIDMGKDCGITFRNLRNLRTVYTNPWGEEDRKVLVRAAQRCGVKTSIMSKCNLPLEQTIYRSINIPDEAYIEDGRLAFPIALIILQLQNLKQLGIVAPPKAIHFVNDILNGRHFPQNASNPTILPPADSTALSVILQAKSGMVGVRCQLEARGLEQSFGLGMQSEIFLHKSNVTSMPELRNVTSLVLVKTRLHPSVLKQAFAPCTRLTRFIYQDPPLAHADPSLEPIDITELLIKSARTLRILCVDDDGLHTISTLEKFTALEHLWLHVNTFRYSLELTHADEIQDIVTQEDNNQEDTDEDGTQDEDGIQDEESSQYEDEGSVESDLEDQDMSSDASSEVSDEGINTVLARLPKSLTRFHIKGDLDCIEIDLVRLAGECGDLGSRFLLGEVAFDGNGGNGFFALEAFDDIGVSVNLLFDRRPYLW
ncbi:hypothetical protein CPLU01_06195 [Colletotrichum plurivorum]|uniref:Uncharacterized protein n=1 Tax=Colletotrichum plurivorum TaxID=2175906 RepID=A0A8H6NH42_9PEZI|nr:hypothetical protein CPLU01_06195 [Colletotrichum plurivorum]